MPNQAPTLNASDPRAEILGDADAQRYRYVLSRDAKQRLDKHLLSRIKGMSRHQVQKLIGLGGVTVNGRPAKPSRSLKKGDVLELIIPPRPADQIEPEPIPLEILYEDEGFIVVNKPAGLVVHPARSYKSGTLINALANHFQEENAQLSSVGSDQARPGIVHRLDKNTTGCILVAKQDNVHWRIARQFENRTNLKAYLALVHGCPDPIGGIIEQPIGKHPTIREAHAVRFDSAGKDALTLYRVRRRYKGYSLVEFELKTGRTHQIRVHASYIGHPIVGDLIYGGEIVGKPEIENPPYPAGGRPLLNYARSREAGMRLEAHGLERAQNEPGIITHPTLHAALLGIDHPVTGQKIRFTAPMRSAMRAFIDTLADHPDEGDVVTDGTHVDLDAVLGNRPGPSAGGGLGAASSGWGL